MNHLMLSPLMLSPLMLNPLMPSQPMLSPLMKNQPIPSQPMLNLPMSNQSTMNQLMLSQPTRSLLTMMSLPSPRIIMRKPSTRTLLTLKYIPLMQTKSKQLPTSQKLLPPRTKLSSLLLRTSTTKQPAPALRSWTSPSISDPPQFKPKWFPSLL